jgi:hypothetical protein
LLWAQTVTLSISFSILNTPSFLSIQNIPNNARAGIIAKLQPFSHYNVIDAVINVLEQSTDCDSHAFNEYMKTLDNERQQNFLKTHTYIAKAMGYE